MQLPGFRPLTPRRGAGQGTRCPPVHAQPIRAPTGVPQRAENCAPRPPTRQRPRPIATCGSTRRGDAAGRKRSVPVAWVAARNSRAKPRRAWLADGWPRMPLPLEARRGMECRPISGAVLAARRTASQRGAEVSRPRRDCGEPAAAVPVPMTGGTGCALRRRAAATRGGFNPRRSAEPPRFPPGQDGLPPDPRRETQ